MRDVDKGEVIPEEGKTLREYITEYQQNAHDDRVHKFAELFDLDESKLRTMLSLGLTEVNIDEFGRFEDLKKNINKDKAKQYFEEKEGIKLIPPKVNLKIDKLLRDFILKDDFEV